jgi:hypothetical protein
MELPIGLVDKERTISFTNDPFQQQKMNNLKWTHLAVVSSFSGLNSNGVLK